MEEDQKREQLQSSGKHIDDKYILGQVAEETEVFGRTNHIETGTDVVDGSSYRGKVGNQIVSVKRYDQKGYHKHGNKGYEVHIDGTDNLMLNGLAIHVDLFDALWMNVGIELFGNRFE